MKRPNGQGSILKYKDKRRKPWRVRVTVEWTNEGKQIYKNLGSFATKKEAEQALSDYFYQPEKPKSVSFQKAYEEWKEQSDLAISSIKNYQSGFNKLRKVYNLALDEFTLTIMQECINTKPCTYSTAATIRKVLQAVLKWGTANNYCSERSLKMLDFVKMPEKKKVESRRVFTLDEIQEAVDENCLGALILLFTGLRRGELLGLTEEDVDLDQQVIHVRKSKTQAGIRDVPIPDGLVPYVKNYIRVGALGRGITYFKLNHWKDYKCTASHTPHDCRHTYITLLTETLVDQRMIKMLVGHAGSVTEDVYTHIPLNKKLDIVNKIFNRYLPAPVESNTESFHQIQA